MQMVKQLAEAPTKGTREWKPKAGKRGWLHRCRDGTEVYVHGIGLNFASGCAFNPDENKPGDLLVLGVITVEVREDGSALEETITRDRLVAGEGVLAIPPEIGWEPFEAVSGGTIFRRVRSWAVSEVAKPYPLPTYWVKPQPSSPPYNEPRRSVEKAT